MKINEMRTSDEVLACHLEDPEFRAEWERTALARAVAVRLVECRTEQGLTQTALAHRLGMKQPAIARLESGEHNPTLETLARLASALGLEFHIEVTAQGIAV